MKNTFFLIALIFCGLSACADKAVEPAADDTPPKEAISAAKANINKQLSQPPTLPELPEDAPEIGTAVTAMINVVKPADNAPAVEPGDVTTVMWEDLIPKDFQPNVIMAKYQAQIDNMPEGAPGEKALFDKIMAEFNSAPPNDALAGKQVKIPGFVTPLDENEGMVGEFLLVPYFGSCIHSPPPPVNQTVLVQPQTGKSIPMEGIYEPVWVTGLMKVEFSNTDLAQAGYLIENAQLEVYQEETN
ncbi:MAG: Putative lipoprotein [uncultured Thiotrichaceae bacterium]|uniref:Lipoprotein n=1 Tax=uncultured Thiotrichaceae bacterium TaxID=298394 RepID=A0A6S6TR85_9GAMM|nr:MAG: Putative lipoprotein [uncultured Thiotrichaceae bacterium]